MSGSMSGHWVSVPQMTLAHHLHIPCSGGGDLGSYLRRYGSVPEPVAHHLLVQLAEGLKVLRANNLIHVSSAGWQAGQQTAQSHTS
jgi:methyl coenzyme M reductase subunit C-like uncharacterized protein (methanogenesis marker protein 7)